MKLLDKKKVDLENIYLKDEIILEERIQEIKEDFLKSESTLISWKTENSMTIVSSINALKNNEEKKDSRIGDLESLPNWGKKGANTFIKTGYRINYTNVKSIIKSLFQKHNEQSISNR